VKCSSRVAPLDVGPEGPARTRSLVDGNQRPQHVGSVVLKLKTDRGHDAPGQVRRSLEERLVGFSFLDRSIDQFRDLVDNRAGHGDGVFTRSAGYQSNHRCKSQSGTRR
jgi:hypothetical protein